MKKYIVSFCALLRIALAELNCTDGQQMMSWRGNKTFSFECGVSYSGGEFQPNGTVLPTAFPASCCLSACALVGSCVLAEWKPATNSCALKTSFGARTQNPNIIALRLVSQPSDVSVTASDTTGRNGTAASYGTSTSWLTETASQNVTSTRLHTFTAPKESVLSSSEPSHASSDLEGHTVIVTVSYSAPTLLTSSAGPIALTSSTSVAFDSSVSALSASISFTTGASTLPTSTRVAPIISKGKRGLLYNETRYSNNFGGGDSQVSWASNWNFDPNAGSDGKISTGTLNNLLPFVPQLWNDSSVPTFDSYTGGAKAVSKVAVSAQNMLAFNEGNQCDGGGICMRTDNQIHTLAESYRQNLQPYGKTVRLGAPSVTNGADGIPWLHKFMQACSGCKIDFYQAHWYGGANVAGLQSYLEQFRGNFSDKPIWLTEFGLDDSNLKGTDEQGMVEFLKRSMDLLDKTEYVERYAFYWAFPTGASNALVNEDGSLTNVGKVFNSYVAG